MKHLLIVVAALAFACGGSQSRTTAPAFEPTAFHVEVHDGDGPPVILIPGLGCSGAVWDDTVAHLAGRERHVLTLAGFAGQPPIAQPLAATTRAELARYIVDRKLDKPAVIGHSMGGSIALWLATSDPALVGPVVVVDSAAWMGEGESDGTADELHDKWSKMTADEMAAAMRGFLGAMMKDPARLERVLADTNRSDPATIGRSFRELYTTDLRPELPKITAPVLFVLAESPYVEAIKKQVATIASHEVVVIPGTQHFVMFDDPDGFFRAIDPFLAR